MQLNLNKNEVEKIILDYAEKIMPGKFNNLIFKSYGNDVELTYVEPEKPKEVEIE